MKSDIVVIGNEIISGETLDTNSNYIARKLSDIGINIRRIIAVGDDKDEIEYAIKNSIKGADSVITSGGLGITSDDITKNVISRIFHRRLEFNNLLYEEIKEKYKKFGYKKFPKRTKEFALVPCGAKIFTNPVGAAPGIAIEINKKIIILLPGIHSELKAIMDESVVPYLREKITDKVYLKSIIRTTGIGESKLAEILEPVISNWEIPFVSFLPSLEGVDICLRTKDISKENAEKILNEAKKKIVRKIKKWVYTTEEEDIIDVVSKLLKDKGLTVSVAESCSGGFISSRLTDISGSSLYFNCGVVSYSNQSKIDILDIPSYMIKKYGAVSLNVAVAMAERIRKISGTDIGLSTTGIFGPTGATPKKPVGLVYIGYSDKKGSIYKRYLFGSDRKRNKVKTTQEALNLLRKKIIKNF